MPGIEALFRWRVAAKPTSRAGLQDRAEGDSATSICGLTGKPAKSSGSMAVPFLCPLSTPFGVAVADIQGVGSLPRIPFHLREGGF